MGSEPPLSEFISILAFFSLQFSFQIVLLFLLLITLLIGSALISGSEVAFFSLSKETLQNLQEEGSPAGKNIVYLRNHPKRLLATILIVNNLVNIGIVLLSENAINQIFSQATFEGWGSFLTERSFLGNWFVDYQISIALEFTITVALATFLLVLFGEVAPKIYARLNNLSLAKALALPLLLLFKLMTPFSGLLVSWTNRIEARFQNTGSSNSGNKDDIDRAIDLSVFRDTATQVEADILKGIVKFNDVSVKQIMRSRMDVVAIDRATTTNFHELIKFVRESGFSRIPVYAEDFDNVVGILYVKDLIEYLEEDESFAWQSLLRDNILYVPETKKINELLKEFQAERLHMAIVVDEYGGSSGIVTLEDVMEEVIGEIKDEFDLEEELQYQKIDDNNFVFEGKTLLNDVCRVVGIDTSTFDDTRGDADSLAGFILELEGKIPKMGTAYTYKNITLTVKSVTARRISKIYLLIER